MCVHFQAALRELEPILVFGDDNVANEFANMIEDGKTVNGHPVRVTSISGLNQARLILDYSPRDALRQHLQTMEWERGFKQTFRIGGSVALNMCLVAKGAAEGYMYGRMRNRVKSWDIATAALLVQNAGGRVLDRHGQPLDTHQPQGFLLCCNAALELHTLLPDTALPSAET